MKRQKGFTLVELMVVIGLITVMAAIGGYQLTRYIQNANLREATRDIENELKQLKVKAASRTDIAYSININLSANSYQPSDSASGKNPETLFGSKIRLTSMDLAGIGNSLSSGTYTIQCLNRGTFNPTSGSVTLVNALGSSATITYNVTGKTHVTYIMR